MTWLRARDSAAPLHAAAEADAPDVVERLLRDGVSVDALAPQRRTALHFAALQNSVSCARLLLKHGAAVDARDDSGCTPLTRAVQAAPSALEVIDELRGHGADPWAKDVHGRAPRMWAAFASAGDLMPDLAPAVPPWIRPSWLGKSDPLHDDEIDAVSETVDGLVAHDSRVRLADGVADVEQMYLWTRNYGPYPQVHLRRPMGPVDIWDIDVLRHDEDGSATIEVGMWTREEGPSGLTLTMWLEPHDAGPRVYLRDLKVM